MRSSPSSFSREPNPGEGNRIVEELQIVALTGRAARLHRGSRARRLSTHSSIPATIAMIAAAPHQVLAFPDRRLFSARAMTAALMFPAGTLGIRKRSITLRPSMPSDLDIGVHNLAMLQVEVGWNTVSPPRGRTRAVFVRSAPARPAGTRRARNRASGGGAMRRTSLSPSTITRRSFSSRDICSGSPGGEAGSADLICTEPARFHLQSATPSR